LVCCVFQQTAGFEQTAEQAIEAVEAMQITASKQIGTMTPQHGFKVFYWQRPCFGI
jgi:hypothetical protein